MNHVQGPCCVCAQPMRERYNVTTPLIGCAHTCHTDFLVLYLVHVLRIKYTINGSTSNKVLLWHFGYHSCNYILMCPSDAPCPHLFSAIIGYGIESKQLHEIAGYITSTKKWKQFVICCILWWSGTCRFCYIFREYLTGIVTVTKVSAEQPSRVKVNW